MLARLYRGDREGAAAVRSGGPGPCALAAAPAAADRVRVDLPPLPTDLVPSLPPEPRGVCFPICVG
jgi:hypothetical protein